MELAVSVGNMSKLRAERLLAGWRKGPTDPNVKRWSSC
jgi:hypothetical protein